MSKVKFVASPLPLEIYFKITNFMNFSKYLSRHNLKRAVFVAHYNNNHNNHDDEESIQIKHPLDIIYDEINT